MSNSSSSEDKNTESKLPVKEELDDEMFSD